MLSAYCALYMIRQSFYEQGNLIGGNFICRSASTSGPDQGYMIDTIQQSCRVLLPFVYLSDSACIRTIAILQNP